MFIELKNVIFQYPFRDVLRRVNSISKNNSVQAKSVSIEISVRPL